MVRRPLLLALALTGCKPAPASERILGTFKRQRDSSYSVQTFEPGGQVRWVERAGKEIWHGSGSYTVLGDTAFVNVTLRMHNGEDLPTPYRFVLHGDTLWFAADTARQTPPFVRQRN